MSNPSDDDAHTVSRRSLLKAAGLSGVALAGPSAAASAQQHPSVAPADVSAAARPPDVLLFLDDEEARFLESAIDTLIPADPQWAGAVGAGVLTYIDRQLAGSYGAGDRMYLAGPWPEEALPEQGYQLRHTPAALYRLAIGEIREAVRARSGGAEFWDLPPARKEDILRALESGDLALPSLPAAVFFETLLANTIEGYFADPAHGGNRDMVSWRMLGFPGAYAQFIDLVEAHGVAYEREPIGLGNDAARKRHLDHQRPR